jgi:hypothetical protein
MHHPFRPPAALPLPLQLGDAKAYRVQSISRKT